MPEETSVVAIEAGQPCFKCGESVDSQDQEPVMFWCADCDVDHVWHGACLPPGLREILEQHNVKRPSPECEAFNVRRQGMCKAALMPDGSCPLSHEHGDEFSARS